MALASDSRRNKASMDAMQDHVPGRFRMFLLTNAPWWIRLPMRLMSVFMKARTREKFMLADDKQIAERLGLDLIPTPVHPEGKLPNFHPQHVLKMFPELAEVSIPVGRN